MGIPHSKPKKRAADKKKGKKVKKSKKSSKPMVIQPNVAEQPPEIPVDLVRMNYKEYLARIMRAQIAQDVPAFLSNQILLSVQFFGNQERDKSQAMDRISAKENQINEKLSKHYIMLPYVLDNAVDMCIKFHSRSTTRKRQPLQLPVMYVVFKNIEILRMSDGDYEWISQCKFVLDTGRRGPTEKFDQSSKGYVKLMSWEIASKNDLARKNVEKKRVEMTALSEDSFSDEEDVGTVNANATSSLPNLYYEEGSVYNGAANRRTSIYSSTYYSSSEYDYAYITHLNTHQPLNELPKEQVPRSESDTKEIPEDCMTPISAIIGRNVPKGRGDAFYDYLQPNEMSFLDSKAFWTYFANTLRGGLSAELGLSASDLDNATYKGASIFTSSYEIIPAIHHAGWPLCAEEWKCRPRPERVHPYTKQNVRWPDNLMIDRVTSFGCHLVPTGYAPKNGKNHFRELEWKVVFPKAEQFLESCLTSAQTKILMISKVLIKSFVEPEQNGETYMFSIDHLRAHLFWECEKDYLAWPEEFLGEKLVYFLKSFLLRLQRNELPDYFIEKRNLFEYVPEKCLSELHDIISRIVHNPAIHLMSACRNLDYVKDFFPKFKIMSLYSALTIEQSLYLFSRKTNSIKDYSYKELAQKTTEALNETLTILPDEERESDVGLIRLQKKKEDRRITKKLMKNEKRQTQQRLASLRKPGVNPIDLTFILPKKLESIKRQDPDHVSIKRRKCDDLRRIYIIELFVQFYIDMAHKSFQQFANNRQTEMYLVQADVLCALLDGYDDYLKATDLKEKIMLQRKLYQDYKTYGITSSKRCDSDPYISIEEDISSLGPATNEPCFEPRSFDVKAVVHSDIPPRPVEGLPKDLPKLNGLIKNMVRSSKGTGTKPKVKANLNGFADEGEIVSTLIEAKPPEITKLNGHIRDKDDVENNLTRKIKFK